MKSKVRERTELAESVAGQSVSVYRGPIGPRERCKGLPTRPGFQILRVIMSGDVVRR